jgi:hypothetical protein
LWLLLRRLWLLLLLLLLTFRPGRAWDAHLGVCFEPVASDRRGVFHEMIVVPLVTRRVEDKPFLRHLRGGQGNISEDRVRVVAVVVVVMAVVVLVVVMTVVELVAEVVMVVVMIVVVLVVTVVAVAVVVMVVVVVAARWR